MAQENEIAAERLAAILAYHEESKHRVDRMAPSLGYMDWANQPEPFRRYEGCPTIRLPLLAQDPQLPYEGLYLPSETPPAPVNKTTLGAILELSLGLSAWKVSGDNRWALRMVPSSGNLHPTEAYVLVFDAEDLPPGVYHYNPLMHALEHRLEIASGLREALGEAFERRGIWITLTSIFWRESWKYGLRAYRYCALDVGHALAGLTLAARLQNWGCFLKHGIKAPLLGALLGLGHSSVPAAEYEHPECFCYLGPDPDGHRATVSPGLQEHLARLDFKGTPNRLSQSHEHWKAIDRTARLVAASMPAEPRKAARAWQWDHTTSPDKAVAVIRRRRSAVGYDPHANMTRPAFMTILQRTLPRMDQPPFAAGIIEPALHLFLFVHRVTDLAPGLYALCRNADHLPLLKAACNHAFLWDPVAPGQPLFLLKPGDFVYEAIHISCDQTMAGYGAFSLGMLAHFHPTLRATPGAYRQLFWEAGQVGHLLYLEAEAQGYRGTGIGCFFDDGMHNFLGMKNREFQSLYHFTAGVPRGDRRLQTLPAYHHLERTD